jgi:hypothetical protein
LYKAREKTITIKNNGLPMKTKIYSTILTVIILMAAFALGFGCSRGPKRPADMPKPTPCTVFVTFGGKVMEGVSVYLTPEDKQVNKWGAAGLTNAEGKAIMKTDSTFTGAVPGQYIISFRKLAEPVDMNTPPSLIPEKYTLGKSQETLTVSRDQSEYTFSLEAL